MPRDGSNIYSQPFPDVEEATTIESAVYNGFTNDVAQDLNAPRPIVAGGTGANNAADARQNIHAETSEQTVTNYDSHIWESGSFYSPTTATTSPVAGHAFAGSVVVAGGSQAYITVEARDVTTPATGILYVRTKFANIWGDWTISGADQYVDVAGDTMTGPLVVDAAITGTGGADITGASSIDGKLTLHAVNGAIGLTIRNKTTDHQKHFRVNGISTLDIINHASTTVISSLSDTGTFETTENVKVHGGVFAGYNTAASGAFYFGNNGTKYLTCDGTNFLFATGIVSINGNVQANGHTCRSGLSGAFSASVFNLNYNAGPVQLWVDVSNLGNITVTSDYRIKKDVADLPAMWDIVKALRPIKYTQADFTPPAQLEHNTQQKAEGKEVAEGPMFVADDVERWGFVAHELQETLTPSAATGVKDSPDHVQSPNPFTLVAALTRALQEAMARIEALEAR